VFSPADFSRPTPPPTSAWDNRLLGAALLVVAIIVLVVMAVVYDQQVFIPFNATYAITQTWQAQHPPIQRTAIRRTPRPRATPTPRPDRDQQAAWDVEVREQHG
jgi:hypothetical protein